MIRCQYCNQPAWYQDRATGKPLCPAHSRLEVCGPRQTGSARPLALSIRPNTPADEPAILGIWNHFWDDDEMECFGRDYRAAAIPALLACDGERVVGVLSYAVEREWNAINIVALNVLPGYQGRGGGGGLMGALEGEGGRVGVGRLFVARSNAHPLALCFC